MDIKFKKYKYYLKTFLFYFFDKYFYYPNNKKQNYLSSLVKKYLKKNKIKKFTFLRIEAFGYSILQYLYLLSKGRILFIYGFNPVNKFLFSKLEKNNLLIKNKKIINFLKFNSDNDLKKVFIDTPINTHNFNFDKKKVFKFSNEEIRYCEKILKKIN